MRFNDLSCKAGRSPIYQNLIGSIKPGFYQYFGRKEFLDVLIGRYKFKGMIDQTRYHEYKRDINRTKVISLNDICFVDEERSPHEILHDYIDFYNENEVKTVRFFCQLRDYFKLPNVYHMDNLSSGQKELYQFIIAYSLCPRMIIGIDCFEAVSIDNFNMIVDLVNDTNIIVIFKSGKDHTRDSKVKDFQVDFDSSEDEHIKKTTTESEKSRFKIKDKGTSFSSYALFMTLPLFILLIITFITGYFSKINSQELDKVMKEIQTQHVSYDSKVPVVRKNGYVESPIFSFNILGEICEVRYDYTIETNRIKDLNLANKEAVISSSLASLLGSDVVSKQYLERFNLKQVGIITSNDNYILMNQDSFEEFSLKYLDSYGNIYQFFDYSYKYFDINGNQIEPLSSCYYTSRTSYNRSPILEKQGIDWGGYYESESNYNEIVYSSDIDKESTHLDGDKYVYRYITTNISSIQSDLIQTQLGIYNSKQFVKLLLDIIFVFSSFLIPIISVLLSLKRSFSDQFKLQKKYKFAHLKFTETYLKCSKNYLFSHLIMTVALLTISVFLYDVIFVILALVLAQVSVLIRTILMYRVYNNFYRYKRC